MAKSITQWAGRKKACRLGLEEGVGRALEVDHLLAVGDRGGALAVGDPAHGLVGEVDADEDADLAPEVAPALGQPATDRCESAAHRAIVIRALTGREDGLSSATKSSDPVDRPAASSIQGQWPAPASSSQLGVGEGVGVGLGEPGRQVGVAVAPEDQRGQASRPRSLPAAARRSGSAWR